VSDLNWRKSSRSHDKECVEVADTPDASFCRDSKDLEGPVLRFPRTSWAAFIDAVKTGDF
jgi:hypothetical protein